ncbi:cellulase family glycosylhydrolase [Labilibaculum sp. 44]|uniref:Cellulase family glycosylhydrolase n=2 Tax=Labilibaculum euxinus TaxID=2686357 RepID=A0A7M4D220_9BACT|nr:cellulase family glycosylhydrolase [Labilibaculum euxinus]MVB05904.1 cellulase family glycosylhydrolase [Labilibaculum euxinus]
MMKTVILKLCLVLAVIFHVNITFAWEGMPMPQLHVEGRYLKDVSGHIVNLHGFAQTYSPWFNEQNSKWTNFDVAACLTYNQGLIDGILQTGWKMNFIRLHMDPYWSNTPGVQVNGENDISAFDFNRFKTYLDQVFIPMAEYAISKGLYVVMRPPGVCPEEIAIGDAYQQYLIQVWGYVAQHPKLKNNPNIMFELANEPVDILGSDGTYGAGTQGHFDKLKIYFQAIVDAVRESANNILWIPGLGYQSLYSGYAANPIEGDNIGYAVHVYPGWFNSGQGYEPFRNGWNNQVQPIADMAPIMVTEMDWAPEKYNASWGKDITGIAGGDGFGANLKKIVDSCGNVSWLLFTSPDLLDDFTGIAPAEGENYVFLNDPEACPWPVYHWYQEYAKEYSFEGAADDYLTLSDLVVESGEKLTLLTGSSVGLKIKAVFADGHIENVGSLAEYTIDNPSVVEISNGRIYSLKDGEATINIAYTGPLGAQKQVTLNITSTTFPLTNNLFNPDIWENGSFDGVTNTLKTGLYGFGGWQYEGIDLTGYKYIIARLGGNNTADISFNIYDGSSYWGSPASYQFGNEKEVVVMLEQAKKNDGTPLNSEHIYIAGFWSNGSNPFVIDTVFLSNSSEYDPPSINIQDINSNNITELNDFYYGIDTGPSTVQQFIVSGNKLTNDIVITSSANYEISLEETQGYSQMISISPNKGEVSLVTIYVRLVSGLTDNMYSGDIELSSAGAFGKTIALLGQVEKTNGIYNIPSSGAVVTSTAYFTLLGQKITDLDNRRGIFIVKEFYSDGTVVATKVLKMEY